MSRMDLLFCERGRGRGHAARDIAIVRELRLREPHITIEFASYDTGASVLLRAGETVHDLELPERNPFSTTIVRTAKLIARLKPRLVIAQEEPAALAAAEILGVRSIFTTHWFPPLIKESYRALEYADHVLFMEESGIFTEPSQVSGRVRYCGPVLRTFQCDFGKEHLIRNRLGLDMGQIVIVVLPGSPPEEREPICELVVSAFRALSAPHKALIWIAGPDYDVIAKCLAEVDGARVVGFTQDVDAFLLASDIVITKGTYNISREAMAVGRPSISLSHCQNWVDDLYARRWASNYWLDCRETSSTMLTTRIEHAIDTRQSITAIEPLLASNGARCVANDILSHLATISA